MEILFGLVVIVLGIGFLFFFPAIMGKMTGTHLEHINGRIYAIVKDEKYDETEEAHTILMEVYLLDKEGYGPYSHYGLFRIGEALKKLQSSGQTPNFTEKYTKDRLKLLDIKENEYTKRVKPQKAGDCYSITRSL